MIKNGTEYEFSFTGKDINNKTITGYYKGPLKFYNVAGDKKSLKSRIPGNKIRERLFPDNIQ